MNKKIRKQILKSLNSGHSANNIYFNISIIIYNKIVYNYLNNMMNPEDFKTERFKVIKEDVEKIIKAYCWDSKRILLHFDCWGGLK